MGLFLLWLWKRPLRRKQCEDGLAVGIYNFKALRVNQSPDSSTAAGNGEPRSPNTCCIASTAGIPPLMSLINMRFSVAEKRRVG